jgi:hypothetical protein
VSGAAQQDPCAVLHVAHARLVLSLALFADPGCTFGMDVRTARRACGRHADITDTALTALQSEGHRVCKSSIPSMLP